MHAKQLSSSDLLHNWEKLILHSEQAAYIALVTYKEIHNMSQASSHSALVSHKKTLDMLQQMQIYQGPWCQTKRCKT